MGKEELKVFLLGLAVSAITYYVVSAIKAKTGGVKTVLASNGYVTSPLKSEVIYT